MAFASGSCVFTLEFSVHKILKGDQVLHSDERFEQYIATEPHYHRSSNLECMQESEEFSTVLNE